MGSHSLLSPPTKDTKSSIPRKSLSSTKSVKPAHRTLKRASSSAATIHHHDHVTHTTGMVGRHKRVRKACERCRMKKTKCDGELPCKRCKDDGLVCTAGMRKKMEYKQLPREYAEVLENTQLALIATIHKLYSMVRNNQPWELGEPELHDRGLPVIRNIAQKLGCIRPNSDIDLPVHSVFPEDEADMAELARQLEGQQKEQGPQKETAKNTDSSVYNRTDSASSSEPDHSDLRTDDRKATYGSSSNALNLSPQSCAGNHNCDFNPSPPNIDAAALYPVQTPSIPNLPARTMSKPQLNDVTSQSLQQAGVMQNMDMLNQGLLKSEFGTIKPHEVMMGMGGLMIYSG